MAREPIFINVGDLAGVDNDTLAAADAGDRQAEKKMLRGLMSREASANALISGHWTDWVLRMIATGARQAVCDALGSIEESARQGEMSTHQKEALDELFEQYFGPGTVRSSTAERVLGAFPADARALEVVQLFLLADRLADGDPSVEQRDVLAAADRADALESPGASAFFRAVLAQLSYGEDPVAAFDSAMSGITLIEPLAENDAVYQVKLGQLAVLCSQLAQIAGDATAATLLRAAYAQRISQFTESEENS